MSRDATPQEIDQMGLVARQQYEERVARLKIPTTLSFPADVMNRIWLLSSTSLTPIRLIPQ